MRGASGRDLRLLRGAIAVAAIVALGACGSNEPRVAADVPPPEAGVALEASRPRIVVLGDSLTAGLGLPTDQAFPSVLHQRLLADGYDFDVVNAGVSGDTSAGGVRRLDWALEGDVRILIVGLGANDGLRGLSVAEMKRNLGEIITRAQARGIAVLLAGMEAPPNFGESYTVQFREAYRAVAQEHRVTFVPFLLDGVAGVPALNQQDGMHPNAAGARKVAEHIWPALQPLLDQAEQRP